MAPRLAPPRPASLAASRHARPDASGSCDRVIEGRVRTVLHNSGHFALTEIRCQARDGALALHGRVDRHYLKQVAQEAALCVADGREVHNFIHVG